MKTTPRYVFQGFSKEKTCCTECREMALVWLPPPPLKSGPAWACAQKSKIIEAMKRFEASHTKTRPTHKQLCSPPINWKGSFCVLCEVWFGDLISGHVNGWQMAVTISVGLQTPSVDVNLTIPIKLLTYLIWSSWFEAHG